MAFYPSFCVTFYQQDQLFWHPPLHADFIALCKQAQPFSSETLFLELWLSSLGFLPFSNQEVTSPCTSWHPVSCILTLWEQKVPGPQSTDALVTNISLCLRSRQAQSWHLNPLASARTLGLSCPICRVIFISGSLTHRITHWIYDLPKRVYKNR